ncbi:MAG: hypothetical protein RLZZ546_998 [Bacteroidota bacterium]
MVSNILVKILLIPFSILYGLGVSFRNFLYEAEIIKPSKFSLPIISIGNLSIGGAGKTPHIEYLVRLLSPYIDLAVLSRGYNRQTSGFRFVSPHDTALVSGDEPLMYARKFPNLPVAVCENRAIGIPQLVTKYPQLQGILLDDAFQHRSVFPFINILLTPFDAPYTKDFLMPSGRLREGRWAAKRANAIIISKCPENLTEEQRAKFIAEIKPKKNQDIFFSKYKYSPIYHFYQPGYNMEIGPNDHVILISAIANTEYLTRYIASKAKNLIDIPYADHHNFIIDDILSIIKIFKETMAERKYVLTTEKDAVRLMPFRQQLYDAQIPVFVLPIEVEFIGQDKDKFDLYIKNELMKFER